MLPSVIAVGALPWIPGGGGVRRRLARGAVVRMVGVGVEALRARLLHRAQERERRDRGPG